MEALFQGMWCFMNKYSLSLVPYTKYTYMTPVPSMMPPQPLCDDENEIDDPETITSSHTYFSTPDPNYNSTKYTSHPFLPHRSSDDLQGKPNPLNGWLNMSIL